MAIKSTVCKAAVNIADMDRNVYADFNLTLARHPSETDERMMLRLLAFVLHAHEYLEFGRGISTEDEPDLWLKSLSGDIETWIELGTPTDKRLRKACGRAKQVVLYCYGGRSVPIWWEKHKALLQRLDNLSIYLIPVEASSSLATLASTNMTLQWSVQDAELAVSTALGAQVLIAPERLK